MFRKGFFALGLLVLGAAALRPEISYPWRDTYIGSLDGPGWPGLVIAPAKDSAFAFLLRVERGGESAEGAEFLYLVSELGPHSPDGLYARVPALWGPWVFSDRVDTRLVTYFVRPIRSGPVRRRVDRARSAAAYAPRTHGSASARDSSASAGAR